MAQKEVRDKKEEGGKKNKILLIVAILIILILIGIIVFLLWPKEEKRNMVVTEDNLDQAIKELNNAEKTDSGYYTVSMNNTWHFADGKAASSDAEMENFQLNTTDVYFDVVLKDDEDHVILKSPIMPPGTKMQNITLDEDLDAGTYDCVCIYHLVDEDQNTTSTLRVGLTIVVDG
jgi:flagellar basal body-associated protein FliL